MSRRPEGLGRRMRLGLWVFGWLVLLEVAEFVVGRTLGHTLIPLIILALPADWLILRYYMHLDQLRKGE